ncbi:hypothetical protein CBR_g32197 [Chara braunii]|uniref:Retrotransposon gag domain-containing protein n=1 Tax=Chara braunii TaxID=69332 RepID=A0A388JN27_CHABU|nr:hypothetical protein CBR_g32197 [Chara braunii]|eukprot:GBG59181.1 hypothetical protein CBR_g32197 [Chara braunii]
MSDHGAQQQPQVEVVMKVEGQHPSTSTPPSPPLTATQQEKELQRQLDRLAERQEAAELEAATDYSRREYLLQQLDKVLSDDRCAQVTKDLAEMIILEHKITSSYFTNWDDCFDRLERRVDSLAAQQSKILDAIQNLTAQLSAAKLIAPQLPLIKPKPSPPSTPPSSPPGSVHSSRSPSHSQKASGKATYVVVTAGDQRDPKIPAPNKFRGDDPKTDVGDWAARTKAYLRGFVCAEQTKVATVLGLLEGPALKWATSTSSSLQQSMEDWAFGLGVDRLLQALKDRFADKERARKAADRISRLGQQRYSGTLQALFAEFEQLTSTPGLVMSTYDLLTNFRRAALEKFVVALYSAGHKDWRSFGRTALDMEAKLHVQGPSSDRRKGSDCLGTARAASFCYEDPEPDQDPGQDELQSLAAFFLHLKDSAAVTRQTVTRQTVPRQQYATVPRQQCHVRNSATSAVPRQSQCHVRNSATSAVPRQQCHVSSATSAVPRQSQCHVSMTGAALGMPDQLANETLAEYKQRFQAQIDLIEAEEKRQLAAKAARVRRKEAQDLLQRHEATSIERLKFWHFEPNSDEATPEEQHKEFMAKLVTTLVYTCNHLQSELANLQRAVRNHKTQHEDATRALDARVQDLEQVTPRPDVGASSSAPSSRQLEERIDHVVEMLGDISTFAAPTTISSQLHTLKTEVQQLQSTNADGNPKLYKMPTFQLDKFDDYTQ